MLLVARGDVQVRARAVADDVLLEVADQGMGITPEQLPRLFQAFERLDMEGAVEGTGIGLALSRSLMALMHGEMPDQNAISRAWSEAQAITPLIFRA